MIIGCGDLTGDITSLTVSPSSAVIGVDQSKVFTVTAKDSNGMIFQVTPSWSVLGTIGNISPSGLFIAGSASGEGYVVARYESRSANAKVIVTEGGFLTGRISSPLVSGYVENIKVYLEEIPSLSDLSDGDGRYEIADIPAGSYRALTQPTTIYLAASAEVTITKGVTTYQNFSLEPQPGIGTTTTTLFETPEL